MAVNKIGRGLASMTNEKYAKKKIDRRMKTLKAKVPSEFGGIKPEFIKQA